MTKLRAQDSDSCTLVAVKAWDSMVQMH